jgi:hypothetical protein
MIDMPYADEALRIMTKWVCSRSHLFLHQVTEEQPRPTECKICENPEIEVYEG